MPFGEFALGVLAKIARALALLGGVKNAVLDQYSQSEPATVVEHLRVPWHSGTAHEHLLLRLAGSAV